VRRIGEKNWTFLNLVIVSWKVGTSCRRNIMASLCPSKPSQNGPIECQTACYTTVNLSQTFLKNVRVRERYVSEECVRCVGERGEGVFCRGVGVW
jgi:hypothetical protein